MKNYLFFLGKSNFAFIFASLFSVSNMSCFKLETVVSHYSGRHLELGHYNPWEQAICTSTTFLLNTLYYCPFIALRTVCVLAAVFYAMSIQMKHQNILLGEDISQMYSICLHSLFKEILFCKLFLNDVIPG